MVYLMGSRYCDTDKMMHTAWSLFANAPQGWGRVQAICDYVNEHLTFGYQHASATRTRSTGYNESAACAATLRTSPSPCAAA
jgi:hypothetical protein